MADDQKQKTSLTFLPLDGMFHVKPRALSREDFVASFGRVYEHSAWVAEEVWKRMVEQKNADYFDRRENLAQLFFDIVERISDDKKLALLQAHPDLAGKAALAGEVTQDSSKEQAGAGLDQCSAEELVRFTDYNDTYKARYGFPFIMAVKGATKETILSGFELRLLNTKEEEFDMAMHQVHQIARFRLSEK